MGPDTGAEAQLRETFCAEEMEGGKKDSLISPLGGAVKPWLPHYQSSLHPCPPADPLSSLAPVGSVERNRQPQVSGEGRERYLGRGWSHPCARTCPHPKVTQSPGGTPPMPAAIGRP